MPRRSADPVQSRTDASVPIGLSPIGHEFLKALANPGRQEIMLLFANGVELSVNEVADRAGVSQSTASQQLSILRRGGIVTLRRSGKSTLYRADHDGVTTAIAELQRYLSSCC